ncbi:hypothetical protein ISG25_36970, partial [Burkholderia pseudomallei]|nr:hypothetical protein [Burkholderia pseudomallei]MBF3913081.1 hypothetical protein [Burkholderia pseudomallei]
GGVPMLPASAPFDAKARLWLDGLLAGLFSRAPLGAAARVDARAAAAAAVPAPSGAADAVSAPSGVRIVRTRPKVVLLWASQTGNVESLT